METPRPAPYTIEQIVVAFFTTSNKELRFQIEHFLMRQANGLIILTQITLVETLIQSIELKTLLLKVSSENPVLLTQEITQQKKKLSSALLGLYDLLEQIGIDCSQVRQKLP